MKNENIKVFNEGKENINMIISGAVTAGKGQIEAIFAINEIINRGYKNITLNIAGSGEIEKINNVIEKLKLRNYVKVLGQVNNLHEIRKEIDIELVCSKSEAFGRVTIEAMMSMIPVIGANTGGTKELIQDGYNGLLYNQGDYISLANQIEYFIKNINEIERMGKNAYLFSEKFTTERNAKEVYKIYQEIIDDRVVL